MNGKAHILLVDDDNEIRKLLGRYLSEQGFTVTLAASRREFAERFDTGSFDLIVLDVMLPDGSGLDMCRNLRQQKFTIPVILLTALKEEVDRIIGLEIGADDYMGKPFSPRELVARIRAVLRRVGEQETPLSTIDQRYAFSGFTVDMNARQVIDPNLQEIPLTGAEFELLKVMLERPGRVLSREQLLDPTQGKDTSPFDRSIDVLMSRPRRKLGESVQTVLFKTIRNGGYQLVAKVDKLEINQ